jgi:hypothetical protein
VTNSFWLKLGKKLGLDSDRTSGLRTYIGSAARERERHGSIEIFVSAIQQLARSEDFLFQDCPSSTQRTRAGAGLSACDPRVCSHLSRVCLRLSRRAEAAQRRADIKRVRLERRIDELSREIDRLVDAIAKGYGDAAFLGPRASGLHEERGQIAAEFEAEPPSASVRRSTFAPSFRLLNRRPLSPSKDKIRLNPRARHARLRAGERTDAPPHGLDLASLGVPRIALPV